ncbi:PH and SEC7 domain-containing protein 2-like [Acipenser oxyrinchus oxyrinchus]|uniref:PH and SEC7 domain-containing protein 2-like n=1 Tax=Acipenser oxyrinchus oxyrinchus TaxID=40147 RepID=A0AAD8FWJ0_ACIOX|nr:PH and SEC7 domain-containing protein 2-like [Acipenser oxyrinchus oxyrinchus]
MDDEWKMQFESFSSALTGEPPPVSLPHPSHCPHPVSLPPPRLTAPTPSHCPRLTAPRLTAPVSLLPVSLPPSHSPVSLPRLTAPRLTAPRLTAPVSLLPVSLLPVSLLPVSLPPSHCPVSLPPSHCPRLTAPVSLPPSHCPPSHCSPVSLPPSHCPVSLPPSHCPVSLPPSHCPVSLPPSPAPSHCPVSLPHLSPAPVSLPRLTAPLSLPRLTARLTAPSPVSLPPSRLTAPNLGKAMSCSGFISNLDGMNEGGNFPRELLKSLYSSIKNEKLEWAVADSELQDSLLPPGGERGDCGSLRSKSNPFQDLAHDQQALQFKQGFLSRKAHADIDGKKTPWGRRSWKVFYAVLKGMVLYLQKSESSVQWPRSEEVVISPLLLSAPRSSPPLCAPLPLRSLSLSGLDSLSSLQAQSSEEMLSWVCRINLVAALSLLPPPSSPLFSSPLTPSLPLSLRSSEEMLSWVCRINLVAALFSSPPFPAAVGSQRRFVRPILPASCSSNCQEDQLEAHKRWMESFSQDLAEHQQNQPDRGRGRAREQEEYRLREEYLQHETMRYDSYVKLLQARLRLGSDDLARFEALVCEGLEGDAGTLTKSHSSPSLNQDSETPVVRVKRNISERRTYRRIIVPRRSREQL